jgi:hypothetical protein
VSEYVTQADREAAQALCASGWTYAIEAFAAHRRASVAALEAENARLRDLLCLADELLMETIGAFPLPGNPLREKVKLIRDVTGSDYNARKAGAARAALKETDHD